ncbi:MAG TPA: hypothetical protein VKZ18_09665 [Polyangia bacterium]|nr:hypothetical protein [Polyangia bacterium]
MTAASVPVFLVALASSGLAQAAVGLAYEAPDGCPTQREFVDAVAARDAHFDGAGPSGAPRVMVVAIRPRGDGFAGVFQVRDGDTATNKREVQGGTCAEVVDALAVVTAIALRPDSAPEAAAPPPVAAPAPPAEAHAAPAPDAPLRGATFRRHAHESVTVPAGTVRFDLARTVDLYGGFMVGAAPSTVVPRFDLVLDIANFVTTPDGAQRMMNVVIRSHLSVFGPGSYDAPGTKTDILGYGAMFGFCMSPHYDSAGLIFLICAEAGAGSVSLRTAATGGASIQSKFTNFGVLALNLEAKYALTSRFEVAVKLGGEAYPGAGSPGWSAEDASGKQIFAASGFSASLSLGIGTRF